MTNRRKNKFRWLYITEYYIKVQINELNAFNNMDESC